VRWDCTSWYNDPSGIRNWVAWDIFAPSTLVDEMADQSISPTFGQRRAGDPASADLPGRILRPIRSGRRIPQADLAAPAGVGHLEQQVGRLRFIHNSASPSCPSSHKHRLSLSVFSDARSRSCQGSGYQRPRWQTAGCRPSDRTSQERRDNRPCSHRNFLKTGRAKP